MSKQAIITTISNWIKQDRISEQLDAVEVSPDTRLLDAAIFDSLKLMLFVSWLEEHYEIKVGIEHLTPQLFATPDSIATLVQQLTNNSNTIPDE